MPELQQNSCLMRTAVRHYFRNEALIKLPAIQPDVSGTARLDADVPHSDHGAPESGSEGGEVGVLCDDGLSRRIVLQVLIRCQQAFLLPQILEVHLVKLRGRGHVKVHNVVAPRRRTLCSQLLCVDGIQSGVQRTGEPALEGTAVRYTDTVPTCTR